jgi:serine/threonine kinase 32
MHRRSYYPHNQQIITTVTASSSGVVASRPVTPGAGEMINGRSDSIGLDSHSMHMHGPPDEYKGHSSEGLHHLPAHDISEKNQENV